VDLGELQVFLMVAKEGSFSRAAERLYRNPASHHLGIRKLEDSLGQPLFCARLAPVTPETLASSERFTPSAC